MNKLNEKEQLNMFLLVLQISMLIMPMILIMIIVEQYNPANILIPYLYCFSAAGWIINLGNGRLAMNIDECKYRVSLSDIKLRKIIHITSGPKEMSKIDYVYQVLGFALVLVGIIFSSIIIIISKVNDVTVIWYTIESPYYLVLLIYVLFIAIIGTIIRVVFYYKEYIWYKRKKRNRDKH